jgi:hypothetical protein
MRFLIGTSHGRLCRYFGLMASIVLGVAGCRLLASDGDVVEHSETCDRDPSGTLSEQYVCFDRRCVVASVQFDSRTAVPTEQLAGVNCLDRQGNSIEGECLLQSTDAQGTVYLNLTFDDSSLPLGKTAQDCSSSLTVAIPFVVDGAPRIGEAIALNDLSGVTASITVRGAYVGEDGRVSYFIAPGAVTYGLVSGSLRVSDSGAGSWRFRWNANLEMVSVSPVVVGQPPSAISLEVDQCCVPSLVETQSCH